MIFLFRKASRERQDLERTEMSQDTNMSEVPPVLPLRRDLSESDIIAKLDAIHASIKTSETALEVNLPNVVRQAMQDVLKQKTESSNLLARSTETTRQDLERIQQEMKKLESSNSALERQVVEQQKHITSLTVDLQKRVQEARKLHTIILQTGQRDESVSDETVRKRFEKMQYDILCFVHRHHSKIDHKTTSKRLQNLTPDDQMYYLRSRLAQLIYDLFFHPDIRLFGLDKTVDNVQARIEEELHTRGVAQADIDDWRIKTIKVCSAMNRGLEINIIGGEVEWVWARLNDIAPMQDERAAEDAKRGLGLLCVSAYELSLTLRGSSSMFIWGQGLKASAIAPEDVEMIGSFNMKPESKTSKPIKVMFGPLWKEVDGERVLIGKGEILVGNSVDMIDPNKSRVDRPTQ